MPNERTQSIHVLRNTIPFALSLLALGWLIFPTVQGIVSRWFKFDESYSHGLLLLAVSLFLTGRTCLRYRLQPGFYPLWLIPFLLALIGYGLGDILRIQAVQQIVVVPLLLGVLAVFMGWRQVRHFIVPVGLLIFTVPVWDFLSWTLQVITVEINRVLLGLMDIEFRVEGVFVYLIGVGTFEVAHGCSGLRYLLVGQSLSVIYGELNLRRLRSRIIMFCCGVLFALAANWIRVFVIIYMGYETNMQTSLIDDHDNFGWWVFAATLVPLFLIGRVLETSPREQVQSPGYRDDGRPVADRSGRTRMAVGVALMVALPLILWLALPSTEHKIRSEPAQINLRLDGEQFGSLFSSNLEGWRPQVRNPDRVYVQTLFERGRVEPDQGLAERLLVSIYSYDFQRHSAELVQYSNRLYDRERWHPENVFTVAAPGAVSLRGVTLRDRVSGKHLHLAYTYYVEGIWETDDLKAKLAQIRGFVNPREDASLIIYGVSCEDCNGLERLEELILGTFSRVVESIDQHYAP
ncbi:MULTISPECIES: exosortase [unclassified Marinobacter]|uniref:exosortase n=1 Tax=unclassified Marinobacter TaxID=83889 RepID=UPI0012683250|nr:MULTISPECIES: exosortase [unclassified Marinobacter]QFS86939.1 Transmembrane exosortase [Marinobacter sp. THAF197a]QFT50723.1 Transmembrane exosortase [Marinobacter sp. THAF39]